MRVQRYILDVEGKPLPMPDLLIWAEWFEHGENRRVERTQVTEEVAVSTVFLGLDHSFSETAPPVLWETMIFGGKRNYEMWRYTSREDALVGHALAVNLVRSDAKKR